MYIIFPVGGQQKQEKICSIELLSTLVCVHPPAVLYPYRRERVAMVWYCTQNKNLALCMIRCLQDMMNHVPSVV